MATIKKTSAGTKKNVGGTKAAHKPAGKMGGTKAPAKNRAK